MRRRRHRPDAIRKLDVLNRFPRCAGTIGCRRLNRLPCPDGRASFTASQSCSSRRAMKVISPAPEVLRGKRRCSVRRAARQLFLPDLPLTARFESIGPSRGNRPPGPCLLVGSSRKARLETVPFQDLIGHDRANFGRLAHFESSLTKAHSIPESPPWPEPANR